MKATSFRFTPETIELLNRLRLPGESQAALIQRALIALDGQPRPLSLDALSLRMAEFDARLTALETAGSQPALPTPMSPSADSEPANDGYIVNQADIRQTTDKPKRITYSADVRALAIKLKDAGARHEDICAEIERVSGRRPHPKSIGAQIQAWRNEVAQ